MASHRRGPWSQAEDNYLCELVRSQGPLNWVRIASAIKSRTPKQCRERYHQNLKPTLNHEPISAEEGVQIECMVADMGKRWAEIARRLQNRSDNAVKNWWNGSMNRRRRNVLRHKSLASNIHSQISPQPYHPHVEADHPHTLLQPKILQANANRDYSSPHNMNRIISSPTVSEVSRTESSDGTPSLVSDTGSALSFSPRIVNFPSVELPPLNYQTLESRRTDISQISSRQSQLTLSNDSHSFLSSPLRLSDESKTQSLGTVSCEDRRYYQNYCFNTSNNVLPPSISKDCYPRVYPENSVRLPPIRLPQHYAPSIPTTERDSRMHLSSLLG